MKITFDTVIADRETFLKGVMKVAKSLRFHGHREGEAYTADVGAEQSPNKPQADTPPGLSLDQILRLEIMMGNLEGVICALELGADLDYSVKGLSNRAMAKAYKDKKIQQVIQDYSSTKSTAKRKPKLSPPHPR